MTRSSASLKPEMVNCATCGASLYSDQSILSDGNYFCDQNCMDQFQASVPKERWEGKTMAKKSSGKKAGSGKARNVRVVQPVVDEGSPIHVDDTDTDAEERTALMETTPEVEITEASASEETMAPDTAQPEVVETDAASTAEVPTEEKKERKKRIARMSQASIWGIYVDFARAKDAEHGFDVLARTFETRSDLSYWLHRIGHHDKVQLTKGRDFVGYFRMVANTLYKAIQKN